MIPFILHSTCGTILILYVLLYLQKRVVTPQVILIINHDNRKQLQLNLI